MSSTRKTQQATLTDFDLPDTIQRLDPERARELVMEQGWSPTQFIREIDEARAAGVAQYLSEHGLKELAQKNRASPAGSTLAQKLDTFDTVEDALAAHKGGDTDE